MKNNKIKLMFSNYDNFLKKRRELKLSGRNTTWETKKCAVEYTDLVCDCDEPGFTMGFDKRPINFYPITLYNL